MMMNVAIPSHLSDPDLVEEVTRLAGCEREATASLIAHLAELFARRLHERAGFSSLFTYCTEVLRLSNSEAYDRMKAAKVVRRYPVVLGLLASGRVNLTTVRLLAPHLTRKNHERLLAEASGKRKRQVQELLARWFPKPDVASSVRKLPAPKVAAATMPFTAGASTGAEAVPAPTLTAGDELPPAGGPIVAFATDSPAGPPIPAPPRPLVLPLAPDRYRVTFTATADMCDKLQLAQDLLRHTIPSGDPAQIFARSLDVLIDELVKQKYAVTDRPRGSRGHAEDSRYVPVEVKRAVYIRDRGCCAFVGIGGRRCAERGFVEFHHVVPYAVGGRATVENIELRCRAHNGYEAEVFYGPAKRYEGADVVRETTPSHERLRPDAFRSRTKVTISARPDSPPMGNAPFVSDRSRDAPH
jgi:hypothetical protein